MKKTLFTFLFICSACFAQAQSPAKDEQQAAAMLKTFYTSYMSAFSATDDTNFEKTLSSLRKRYCTLKCQHQYKKLAAATDADPIINGQDSDAKWAATLAVKKLPLKPDAYVVSYYYDEEQENGKIHKTRVGIKLKLKKVNSSYQIDEIL